MMMVRRPWKNADSTVGKESQSQREGATTHPLHHDDVCDDDDEDCSDEDDDNDEYDDDQLRFQVPSQCKYVGNATYHS